MFKDLSLSKLKKELQQTNLKKFVVAILVIVAIFFGSQIAGAIIGGIVLSMTTYTNDTTTISDLLTNNVFAQLFLTFIVAAVMVGSVLIVAKKIFGEKEFKSKLLLLKKPTLNELGEVALIYVVYFLTVVVSTIILSAVTSVNIDQAQDLGIADPQNIISEIAIFGMLVILPPIYEEIFFRGFVFHLFKKYSGIIVSFISTSILFGVAHLEYGNLNWIAAVDTLLFSGFLIYISQKHKSIYSAMLLHALKNSIAFYVLFVH